MKRLVWIGLITLSLALVAAQCGTVQVQPASQGEASAPEVTGADTDVEALNQAADQEEASGETSGAVVVEVETSMTDIVQAEACDDPFAGVNVQFPPDIWHAGRIAHLAGPEVVDPDSGLETNFCKHSIDYADILSGGPPPDGIPPIDNPGFETIAEGDEWLHDVQPVVALVVGDEARAYPLSILTWHEIANDEINGVPVAITFCPLCNAAVVFNREVDGEVLRFGVSGNLRNSDMVMWDNKTLSWWQQFTGQGIVGDMTGVQLEMIPAPLVAWKDFKSAYPEGQVMSRNTGHSRNYGVNPYANYDSTTSPFLFTGVLDPRLAPTERVLGYFRGDIAKAYPLREIREAHVIEDKLDDQDVVIFYEPGQVSALDKPLIENSKEVGSAGMFIPEVNGQGLTFAYQNGNIVDLETGSVWDVFGQAVTGELAGTQLDPVLSHMHFWFAWAAFRPDTEIYGE